jgi:hypothetical protein
MDNLLLYFELGWEHIVSVDAFDHQLFLLALVSPFAASDYRKLLILISAFTLGHCLTLALSSTGTIRLSSYWIEILIPFTIFLTAFFQLLQLKSSKESAQNLTTLYSIAGLFGLIHGLGFANTLKSLLGREQSLLVPLAGFNIGIELGQIAVLAFLLFIRQLLQYFFPGKPTIWIWTVCLIAATGSIWMIWDRI